MDEVEPLSAGGRTVRVLWVMSIAFLTMVLMSEGRWLGADTPPSPHLSPAELSLWEGDGMEDGHP